MKQFIYVGFALLLAACGGSGSNPTPTINIDPVIDNRTALAPTLTAADVTQYQADFAFFDDNFRNIYSSENNVSIATYKGAFYTQSPMFYNISEGDPIDRSMEMYGDLEMVIDFGSTQATRGDVSGIVTNINLVVAGAPTERLDGQVPLRGGYNFQNAREIISSGSGAVTGKFGTDTVGDARLHLSFSGYTRAGQYGVAGKVRGFMSGDYESRMAGRSSFYGVREDRELRD